MIKDRIVDYGFRPHIEDVCGCKLLLLYHSNQLVHTVSLGMIDEELYVQDYGSGRNNNNQYFISFAIRSKQSENYMNIAMTMDGWTYPWSALLYDKSDWNADIKRYYMYDRNTQKFDYNYADGPDLLDRQGAEIINA